MHSPPTALPERKAKNAKKQAGSSYSSLSHPNHVLWPPPSAVTLPGLPSSRVRCRAALSITAFLSTLVLHVLPPTRPLPFTPRLLLSLRHKVPGRRHAVRPSIVGQRHKCRCLDKPVLPHSMRRIRPFPSQASVWNHISVGKVFYRI